MLSAIVGAVVLSATDWDVTSPTGVGAYVGRIGAQREILDVAPTPLGLPLWGVVILQIPLWASLLAAVWIGGGRSIAAIRERLGVELESRDIPVGIAIGVAAQLALVPLLYVPIFWLFGEADLSGPARALTDRADSALAILLLAIGVGIVAPIVEELFFRGLLLRTLEAKTPARLALVGSAVIFAAIHFQLLQFPALMLFGLLAGTLAQRYGRLGAAIWAHIAFNLVTVAFLVSMA